MVEDILRRARCTLGSLEGCRQARYLVAEWTTACEAALLRLVRYLKAVVDWVLFGYVEG